MGCIRDQVFAIELQGSDRQVEWAKSLRAQKVRFFEVMGNRKVLEHLKPMLVEAEVRVMNAFHPTGLGWIATATVIQACSSREARFWIDKREEDPVKWLWPAYGEVLLHHMKHPFPDA